MARGEYQSQQVVADLVVDDRLDVGRPGLFLDEIAAERRVLLLEHAAAPDLVDGPALRGRHEPGARVLGYAVARPPLERGHEGVLRELLCDPDVTQHPSEPRDELW